MTPRPHNLPLNCVMNVKARTNLDFRPGGVVEGHVVKLNVPFDPVQLVPSLRETIDLGLLRATGLRR